MARGGEDNRVHGVDLVRGVNRQRLLQDGEVAASETFIVQEFGETGRRLFARDFVIPGENEDAFGQHAFREIGFALAGLHLAHELGGALEVLRVIREQEARTTFVSNEYGIARLGYRAGSESWG